MKGKNFTLSDWKAMNLEIASGLNEDEVIAQRRPGVSEANARLYLRARKEGNCITHQEAVKWATAHRPKSGKTCTADPKLPLQEEEQRRTFGEEDYKAMTAIMLEAAGDIGDREAQVIGTLIATGLSRENVRRHLQIYKRYGDLTYKEHYEHYRLAKLGAKKNAPPTAEEIEAQSQAIKTGREDGELLSALLQKIKTQSFRDLLYANGVTIKVRKERVEIYYENYGYIDNNA